MQDGVEVPAQPRSQFEEWLGELQEAGEQCGLQVHVNDEFGFFEVEESDPSSLRAKRLFNPEALVRVEPTGHVRRGREVLTAWDPTGARRWNPQRDHILEGLGMRGAVRSTDTAPVRGGGDRLSPQGAGPGTVDLAVPNDTDLHLA